ncbi:MAG TPA: alpha-amylase family glycosyl hydrolase [Myxococcales bacterium]|nr:alpha-amylase family glycosyl hydrolase [Myxococcales bacterium]
MRLLAHHDGALVRPAGPRLGDEVELSLWAGPDVAAAWLRAAPDGEEELWPLEPREAAGRLRRFSARLRLHWPELRYRFRLEVSGSSQRAGLFWLTARTEQRPTPVDGADFLLRAAAPGPDWLAGRVFYQVFPDRFARGPIDRRPKPGEPRGRLGTASHRDWHEAPLPWSEGRNLDFHGGDLDGLRGKLDHLEALGVSGLYLTPIFASLTNHRYDTLDHAAVDPALGGDAALAALAEELRRRSFRYLLDAVVNHVGSGHRWFNREGLFAEPGAFQSREAPSADYFRFERWPDRYGAWKGVDLLPKLDFRSQALRDALYRGRDAALRRWVRPPFLADGYRFDAANMVARDRDVQLHQEIWPELCASLREERSDLYLLGEHYFDPSPIVGPGRLDGTMNYLGFAFPIRRWLCGEDPSGRPAPLAAGEAAEQMSEVLAALGWQTAGRMMLHVDTHDVPRLRSVGGEAAFRAATVLQLAWPGVPCLYYGDEVGLPGGDDPDNRRPMPWGLPAWREDALVWMKAALGARRDSAALREGMLWIWAPHSERLVVARALAGELALAIADRTSRGWEELDLSHVPGVAGLPLRDVHSGERWIVSPEGVLEVPSGKAGGRLLVGTRATG